MRTWPFVIIALGGAGAFAAWQDQHHRAEMAALEQRLDKLGASLADQRLVPAARLAAQPAARPFVPDPAAPAAAPEAPPARAEPALPPPTREEVAAHVDQAYADEPVDRAWAPDAQQTLRTGLGAHLPDRSELRGVDCHASLCRIEVSHPSGAEDSAFIDHVQRGDGIWSAPGMVTRTRAADGSIQAVVYLAREGHALPFPGEIPADPPPG